MSDTVDFLAETDWMCPDIDMMTFLNFMGQKAYSSYDYQLLYCDAAAQALSYQDLNCETDHSVTD